MSLQVQIIPVTAFQQNCALITNNETKTGVVIDPGGDVPAIETAIKKSGVKVTEIYLTHGHIDHAGGATELAAALGVPIIGPGAQDQMLLDDLTNVALQYGLQGKNCTPTRYLQEGDVIDLAGTAFEVLHCPGHTPGHMVFINRALKFGIFGDVLFRGSVGRTDFPYCDTAALITAIKTKLLTLPDDFAFICGHGEGSTIGAERRTNPFIQ